MKILVLGAGVIGSLYAAKLHDAGEDVTLFARGSRYDQLRSGSVSLRDASTGRVTFRRVPVTGELALSDGYELIIISVRLDQLDPVLDLVRRHTAHPLVLCMCNNPDGVDEVAASLAPRKVIFGFPGAGGARMGDTIRFLMIPRQKTTLGTADGRPSGELQRVKALLETAGFKTAATTRIGAWLRVHAVFMSAVSAAICQAGGDAASWGAIKKRSPSW
jgi:2-dehydropantoate 2-reductase